MQHVFMVRLHTISSRGYRGFFNQNPLFLVQVSFIDSTNTNYSIKRRSCTIDAAAEQL